MERYSIIPDKNPREIVMLRGNGCKWLRCSFCDYHLDSSKDENANYELNREVLSKVTGKFKRLEVINSGSFVDLDSRTINEIQRIATLKGVDTIHFECHWMHRDALAGFRARFAGEGITIKFKIGVETFSIPFREKILKKGFGPVMPEEIAAAGFDEVNLLFGIEGQTANDMLDDIQTGLKCFERVCVNIMTANSTKIIPSESVINDFINEVYPLYKNNPRVDILLKNTDFGVG